MAEIEVFNLALKNGNPDPTQWPQLTSSTDNQLDLEGSLKLQPGVAITKFSNDVTLAGNSALTLPTEQAVKTYVETQIGQVNTALATKALLAGATTQDFTTKNLTVQGNGNVAGSLTVQTDLKVQGKLEVTGTTTFRNIEQHQGNLDLGDADGDEVRVHGKLLSTHSSGMLQVGSPLQVTGTITATKFVGDGSGLTGLPSPPVQWVSGTGGNLAYTGGNVGIGIANPAARLDLQSPWGDWLFLRQERDSGGGGFHIHNAWGNSTVAQGAADRNRLEIGYRTAAGQDFWGQFVIQGATGNVGIGTVSPNDKLDVVGPLRILTGSNPIRFTSGWSSFPDAVTNQAEISNDTGAYKTLMIVGNKSAGFGRRVSIWDRLEVNGRMSVSDGIIQKGGDPITSTADLGLYSQVPGYCMRFVTTGGGVFWFFSDGGGGTNIVAMIDANGKYTQRSSQKYKENIENLSSQAAFTALEELRPVQFNFKQDEQKRQHIGFIAEELPELVATPDREMLSSTDIIAVLTQVVKDQQSTILELKQRVCALEHQHSV
jgi:Chaperone of endosialidase